MGIGAGLAGQFGIADEVYTNEVQGVAGTPSTPFTLTYDGATTSSLATNCSAAAMQAALEALPNIGTGGVVCAGGALPTKITVTFSGPLVEKRNVAALVVNTATGLTVTADTPGTGFGDYVAPTAFYDVESAKPALDMDRIVSPAIRPGNLLQRTDRKIPNKKGAAWTGTMPVTTKGFSKVAKGIMGKAPVITTPTNGVLTRRHRHTLGDSRNISQTLQTGVPTVLGDANNVKPVSSLGAKVASASFKQDVDGYLVVDLEYDAMDETIAQALAAASYTTFEMFPFNNAAVTVNGANQPVTKFQLDIKRSMANMRRFIRSSGLKKQQVLNGLYEITGTVGVEFESTDLYTRFAAATLAGASVPIVVTFTGSLIESVTPDYFNQAVFTMPQCDLTGSTPTLEGNDVVMVDIPFTLNWDGTVEGLTLDLFTTDTTT